MNQLIELQSIRDLSQYIVNQTGEASRRRKFYLYFYNKSHNCETLDAPPCHIDARTIHIGNPFKIRIKNRDNVFYDDQLALNKLGFNFNKDGDWRFDNPYVKQDIGDSIEINYAVYYELKPGATRFENKKDIDMRVSPILFEEVSVFDMGDIGYELAEITPEQAAEKYFGHSDFTKFFSNYALASKQMSLTPRERRSLGIERISLTGMHPVNPSSSFHDYVNAGKQLFSGKGKHELNRVVTPSKTASVLAGAAGGLMLKSGRPLSALATMSVPFLAMLHSRIREQQELNNQQKQKMVALSGKEQNQLLTKGAMASELMRRLTTDTTHLGRNDSFALMHRHVHPKPTHPRIHSETNAETNGGKMRRTKKNKMRRTKKNKTHRKCYLKRI
jgi:hypothetical protein